MTIHLFNGFQNPHGGSENESLELARGLRASAEVRLWATSSRADRDLLGREGIVRLRWPDRVPDGGTYLFVGRHWRNKLWPRLVPRPRRLIYVFNTFHPKHAALTARHPPLLGWPPTEYVFISHFQQKRVGLDGVVHPSPIDLSRFPMAITRPDSRPLVVGKLARDVASKHHPLDAGLYRRLAAEGFAVRLQGALPLEPQLAGASGITLTPEGALPSTEFLSGLDVFFYRTEAPETFGRVVFEAMATCLPVVCHRVGGYAEHIRHGENGFLFDTDEEALSIIRQLAADRPLRGRIGAAARRTVEVLYGPAASAARLAFYLR